MPPFSDSRVRHEHEGDGEDDDDYEMDEEVRQDQCLRVSYY